MNRLSILLIFILLTIFGCKNKELDEKYLSQIKTLGIKKNIKIKVIGNINPFPINLKSKIIKLQKYTQTNNKIQINIALNYGARDEIINTVKMLNRKGIKINEINISKNLYTKDIPDPEILIRTGNRFRLSNFLLWQSSYTEIFFVKKLWPDFNENDYLKILNKFKIIKRNFGRI